MSTMTIPPMIFEFTLDLKGEETQKFFTGNFTYERLTLGERAEVDKMKAKLTEGLTMLPDEVFYFYDMISFLRFGLKSSPDWWKESNYGLKLKDMNIITTLYKECMSFEEKWAKDLESKVKPKEE